MMYAVQLPRWLNGIATDHPCGMFLNKVGKCTETKASAQLFDTNHSAEDYVHHWRSDHRHGVHDKESMPLWIVEVETKAVMTRVTRVIRPV